MKEYVLLLLAASVLAALVRFLCSGSPLLKQIDGAMGIILLLAALSGFLSLSEEPFKDMIFPPQKEYEDAFIGTAEEALADALESALRDEFGLREDCVSVKVTGLARETLIANEIEVLLRGGAVTADFRRIRDYVDSLGHGECEVRISFA